MAMPQGKEGEFQGQLLRLQDPPAAAFARQSQGLSGLGGGGAGGGEGLKQKVHGGLQWG